MFSIATQEVHKDGFTLSTDRSRLDIDVIHSFLSRIYWAEEMPKDLIKKSIEHSLCYGIYEKQALVAFGRIVTDYATYAYLTDIFVLESHRGKGLSKWMVECMKKHPDLQNLRRWTLATRDAHGLYEQFGFTALKTPERYMEIVTPNVYKQIRQS